MSTAKGHRAEDDGWTVVVPVKALESAKSRLSTVLTSDARRELVLAMATDVLRACLSAPGVRSVRVVSPDPEVRALADRLRVGYVNDPEGAWAALGPDGAPHCVCPDDPLNTALTAALVDITGPAAVVTADLPELTSGQLSGILARAVGYPHSVVTDHRGVGTTMAFWTSPTSSRVSRFGTGSADRFRIDGSAVALPAPEQAARDVDTPRDLSILADREVGPATAAVLRRGSPTLTAHPGAVSATMVP